MCCIAKLALLFVICTVGEAAVLKLMYVSSNDKDVKYLEFEESEVHRVTRGIAETDKKSTVRFIIPTKMINTKLEAQEVVPGPPGSKPGYSIVFAKDESNNTLPLKPKSEIIEKTYFRPYNEYTDDRRCYADFTVGSGSSATRLVVFTQAQAQEHNDRGDECLNVSAQVVLG